LQKIGLIDFYLDQYHAWTYPQLLKEGSEGNVQVVCAWAKTEHVPGKTNAQYSAELGIPLLGSEQEVIDSVDGIIVMSPDNAEMHEELSQGALASGKPVYVDKTFSPDRASAVRMIERAQAFKTPFYTSSALRYSAEVAELQGKEISFIASRGPGGLETYSIHQVEPLIMLMGTDVKRVISVGETIPLFVIQFADGREATVSHMPKADFAMSAIVEGKTKEVVVRSDYYKRFIADLVGFFEDARPRVDIAETLAIMGTLEALKAAAKKPFEWVTLAV
jgi:hypothetical protein